jgi:hypothetical protein
LDGGGLPPPSYTSLPDAVQVWVADVLGAPVAGSCLRRTECDDHYRLRRRATLRIRQ